MTRTLLAIPYDSGHREARMGRGPERLRRELGWDAETIEADNDFATEISTSFQLYRRLAQRIRDHPRAAVPVVLAGNCGAAIGAASAVAAQGDLGIIWFDAHGDFNTPETSRSGYLDGMALSVLAGRCFAPLASQILGFRSIAPRSIVHAGGHDLDPSEVEDFREMDVKRIAPGEEPAPALDALAALHPRVVVHIDLDVLDIRYGRANPYAREGGMSPDEVQSVLRAIGERFAIAAVVMASYDPTLDGDGGVAAAGASFLHSLMMQIKE